MIDVKRENGNNWYDVREDGSIIPCYEVPRATGEGMRPATVADARKFGWVPRVTSVLRVLSKPDVVNWQLQNAIGAALTLPRLPGEELDAFAKRVVADMDAFSDTAKSVGISVHEACADILRGQVSPCAPEIEPFVEPVRQWLRSEVDRVYEIERTVGIKNGNGYGYAGTYDASVMLKGIGDVILDFKTQRVRKLKSGLKSPVCYPEWPIQLAAYSRLAPRRCALVNVIIDVSEPQPVFVKVWDNPERFHSLWDACLLLWRHLNNMDQA